MFEEEYKDLAAESSENFVFIFFVSVHKMSTVHIGHVWTTVEAHQV